MLGLVRAEEARGNQAAAAHTRALLGSIWVNADTEIKAQLQSK